jgi:phosphoribosylanthranilate isomerase
MTRVKICGIQRLADAQVAAQAGADFIGLVFVPERRRRLELEEARDLISQFKAGLRDRVLKDSVEKPPQVVGLFADQTLAEINRTIDFCGLDLVQLCGQESHESLDYCRQVRAKVIKVLHVAASTDAPAPDAENDLSRLEYRVQTYRQAGHLVTLDRLVAGLQGGTGQSFDWGLAAQLSKKGHQFLLAGGLDSQNVAQAIARVQPWGVDVSSGVETDGGKDPEKIKAFVRNARGGDGSTGSP